jgi:hypothetical protein
MNKFAVSNNDAAAVVSNGSRHLDSASINFLRQFPAAVTGPDRW